jgi:hypothetical protein
VNRKVFASGFALVAALTLLGCGGDPAAKTTNTVTPELAAGGDMEKIKEALKKAGIKNPPSAVFDQDEKNWSVTITPDGVGPNGEPPPGRPIPERVIVSKVDFSVTRGQNPNSSRPGQGGDRVVQ